MRKKLYLFFYCCFIATVSLFAQNSIIDSLLNKVERENENELAQMQTYMELVSASYNIYNYDTAIYFSGKALIIAQKYNKQETEADLYKQLGSFYDIKGNYLMAAEYLFTSLNLAEKIKAPKIKASVLLNIGILFFELKKADEAISYYNEAAKYSYANKDTIMLTKVLNNIGNAYMTLKGEYAKAASYFELSVKLAEKANYNLALTTSLNNLTQIYLALNEYDKAKEVAEKMYLIMPDSPYVNYNLASVYKTSMNYDKSIAYYKYVIDNSFGEKELKQVALKDMADTYFIKGDYKPAYECILQFISLKDSIHSLDVEKAINELSTKYKTEKKEEEIKKLTILQKQKTYIIYVLVTGFALLSIIIFFVYRNILNKRTIDKQFLEIQKQKIRELEKDKQLNATNAVLEGEEVERRRLARDLHDGLGGLLSGVKLTLSNMKDNVIVNHENVKRFDHALNLLDDSIKELRRVAHKMMPETLVKFGLKEALSDFCHHFGDNAYLKVSFQFFGSERRFDSKIEITVYRVLQELVNNSIKHAEASQLMVQLIQEENRIHLTVQDNGKGFDIEKLDLNKGIGISNIRTRVESVGGLFNIYSEIGKGTEATIEFNNIGKVVNY